LKLANINGQMVIIGVLNKLEFWNPDDCEEFPPMEEVADSFDINL
jgi:DNA-binding transcriptional regulator/RsmH inhibitor MraZ